MIKKIRILGIAPYKGLATLMKQCALQYPEIEFLCISQSSILVLAIMMYCAVLKWPRIPGPNLPF